MTLAVDIQNVSKVYAPKQSWWRTSTNSTVGFRALDQVSLQIQQGEFFGLLGPNGAGKTSLISILAGLSKPTTGKVTVCGYDVQTQFAQARRALGVVPQELVFDPFFTVRESLKIQSGYFGLHKNDDWIDEVLANLGLSDKAHTNMRALSGGMKRRVLVAQALVHRPPVILLDEPTAGVDVDLRRTLWDFITRLNRQGHTILLTTHYLEEAESMCHRLALLKTGRVVALDRTAALLDRFGTAARVTLRSKDHWPVSLPLTLQERLVERDGTRSVFRLESSHELESILAQVRTAGIALEEIQLSKPDLEEVFVSIISDAPTAQQNLQG